MEEIDHRHLQTELDKNPIKEVENGFLVLEQSLNHRSENCIGAENDRLQHSADEEPQC